MGLISPSNLPGFVLHQICGKSCQGDSKNLLNILDAGWVHCVKRGRKSVVLKF